MQKENHILGANLKKSYKYYILQSSLGALYILTFFIACHNFIDGTFVLSFTATTFIVFSFPCSALSSPRNIIGGYIVGALIGIALYFLNVFLCQFDFLNSYLSFDVLCGALAFLLTMFAVVAFDCKHAPAVAFSVSLAIGNYIFISAVITILAVVLLCLLKHMLKKYLINLT